MGGKLSGREKCPGDISEGKCPVGNVLHSSFQCLIHDAIVHAAAEFCEFSIRRGPINHKSVIYASSCQITFIS